MEQMELMPLDDSRWAAYHGGYNRVLYDVVPLIHRLNTEGTSESFWEIVWNELHHQGDVGEASYALVPYLVDYQSRQHQIDAQLFHFCVIVDLARPENGNPPIPSEIELSYELAIRNLPIIGVELLRRGCAEEALMGVVAAAALAAGHRVLARAYVELGRADALEYLSNLNGYTEGPADE